MPTGVSRAVIEVLLDRVQQGAATVSPDGRMSYANQRLASMIGRGRAEFVGKALVELVTDADREALASALATGRDGASQCQVAMARANGGGELRALLTFAPLGHGQASCLVTDLAHGRNSSTLAHEVRNMLGSIRDSIELLRRSGLNAEAQGAIESMERHSVRMLEVLNSKEQAPSS